jgi:hypothetical protein
VAASDLTVVRDLGPAAPNPVKITRASGITRALVELFLFLVWLIASASLVWFVARYGVMHPLWDEWQNVPYLTGDAPLDWQRLWAPWADHRVPLLRLLLMGLARLTKVDFRAPMILSAALLSAVAAAMLCFASRVRRGPGVTDVFLVLVLLNFGHFENLLQGGNLQNVLFTALTCIAFLCIASSSSPPRVLLHVILLVCLVLLPWASGTAGALVALPLSMLLAFSSLNAIYQQASKRPMYAHSDAKRIERSPHAPLGAPERLFDFSDLVGLTFAVAAVVGACMYLWSMPTTQAATATMGATFNGAFLFLSTPFVGHQGWLHGAVPILISGMLCILAVVSWLALWQDEGATFRTMGILLFGASMVVLALAVAWGRAGIDPNYCRASRYGALAVPLPLAVYITTLLARARYGQWIRWDLVLLVALVFSTRTAQGVDFGRALERYSFIFLNDVRSGTPPELLAVRHLWLTPNWLGQRNPINEQRTIVALQLLKDKRLPPFSP